MKRATTVRHEFVETIPSTLQEGTVYVSIPFATAVHKCCCGCGNEVVTPITPTDWQLTFDGDTITLHPSIGSWNLPCKAHYFIRRNTVQWAREWTPEEVRVGRSQEQRAKQAYYEPAKGKRGVWQRLRDRLR